MNREFFKEIDIRSPIWKTRSVGLAVDDVPIGENVKVTISYKKAGTGELLYPGDYIINVDEIRKFPVELASPVVRVHIVPIAELAKLTVFNNNQKPTNMLFGSNELKTIIKESEEAKAGNFDNKKLIEAGKHVMIMKSITMEKAKDQNPMVVAEFELDEDHRTIKEFMKLAGPNTDIPRQRLVKLFHRGFGYEIQPSNTEADLMNQLIKFIGKKLTVAVKGKKAAYCFNKDGKDIVMEQTYPEFWYCGSTSEFDEMTIDMSKAINPLSDEDKDKLVRFAEMNGGPYVPKVQTSEPATKASAPAPTKAAPAPVPVVEQPVARDPQPIENVSAKETIQEAEIVEETATEAPIADAPSAPAVDNGTEADDDFPF